MRVGSVTATERPERGVMADRDIFENIDDLVSEERDLRDRSVAKMGLSTDDKARLRAVEVQLDQCWDLLRRRRALSEYGEDPETAKVRPAEEVEGYQS
ncbi:hypothetical protein GCM10010342_19380 [Streptomyces anulatus]|nr:hypothetical protein GCM10010342_19380 [Streptomyces anulatus]